MSGPETMNEKPDLKEPLMKQESKKGKKEAAHKEKIPLGYKIALLYVKGFEKISGLHLTEYLLGETPNELENSSVQTKPNPQD